MESNKLEILSRTEQRNTIGLRWSNQIENTRRRVHFSSNRAIDRFSKWPTAHICKNTDTLTV